MFVSSKIRSRQAAAGLAFALAFSLSAVPLPVRAENTGTTTNNDTRSDGAGVGVLAADMEGHFGYAIGYANMQTPKAQSDAVAGCGAPGCKVIMTVYAKCVGFADSHANGYWYGNSYAPSSEEAGRLAVNFCNGDDPSGRQCKLQIAVCQ